MNRRGFALVSVLWLLALLIAAAGPVLETLHMEGRASAYRLAHRRGAWAAAGCWAVVEARLTTGRSLDQLDSLELGPNLWCAGRIEPGFGRIDLGSVGGERLRRTLGSDSLAIALQDWIDADTLTQAGTSENTWYRQAKRPPPRHQPLAAVEELLLVRGFDSATVERLRDEVVVWPAGIPGDCAPDECARRGTTMVIVVEGHVDGYRTPSRERFVVRRAGGRLAILAREVE
ncbi:MAG: general secretion pathway protein GspK [Gemmatimonadales bacterium]|nr:general secretion pathway protein GspK [Gemmatimonadales bacterium]